MNTSQIIQKARVDADAIRLDTTISPLWKDGEMVDLVNEVIDTVIGPQLRLTRRHHYVRRMTSLDPTVTIFGQSYSPLNLRVSSGTQHLVLPPDFIEVVRLVPVLTASTTVNASVRFKPRDIADPAFVESDLQDQINPGNNATSDFFYDLVGTFGTTDVVGGGLGNSMLRITPSGSQQVDTELLYVARQPSVYLMSSGTIATGAGSAIVGTGTDFTLVPLPAELVAGDALMVAVDTNRQYPPVTGTPTATTLSLATATTAGLTGVLYQLSSVPPVPAIHHRWIANMVTDLMVRKISAQLAQTRLDNTVSHWREQVLPDLSAPRQSQEPVYTTPYIPDII